MADYFGEKSQQVEPSVMTAFGIEISSRYGRANELTELLRFAEQVALENVAQFVKAAAYDSKAGFCTFELDPKVKKGSPIAATILGVAKAKVGHFLWFDIAEYGEP